MGEFKFGSIVLRTTSTATAAGTTTLTNTSTQIQNFTGTTTQTIKLPDATTMSNGQWFEIYNASTGALTLQFQDASAFSTSSIPAGNSLKVVLVNNGSANGTWATDVPIDTDSGGGFTEFFSATSTSTTTISNGTVLTFTTQDFDTLSGWNGSDTYTVQATGKYKVIGAFSGTSTPFGSNSHFEINAAIGGTSKKMIAALTVIGAGTGSDTYACCGEALFNLSSGNTITLKITTNSSLNLTGTASQNYFQVYRVG